MGGKCTYMRGRRWFFKRASFLGLVLSQEDRMRYGSAHLHPEWRTPTGRTYSFCTGWMARNITNRYLQLYISFRGEHPHGYNSSHDELREKWIWFRAGKNSLVSIETYSVPENPLAASIRLYPRLGLWYIDNKGRELPIEFRNKTLLRRPFLFLPPSRRTSCNRIPQSFFCRGTVLPCVVSFSKRCISFIFSQNHINSRAVYANKRIFIRI